MSAKARMISAEEYFAIALPTPEDFAAWTRQLHAWADDLNARLEARWPELFGPNAKKRRGEMPLFDNSEKSKGGSPER